MTKTQVTKHDILQKLTEVAAQLGPAAQDTLLSENLNKHAFEVKLILERCGHESRILDLGGGIGINLLCLRKLNHSLKLHLVDRFEKGQDGNRTGTTADGLRLMRDASISAISQAFLKEPALPFDAESCDVVTCLDVLDHLPGHPLKLLAEIHRVLKRDGAIIISGPNAVSLRTRLKLLAGKQPYIPFDLWCHDKYASYFRLYTRREFSRMLEMVGFTRVKTRMMLEPSNRRAKDRKGGFKGVVITALMWAIYFTTALVPGYRPAIYAVARKPATLIS